MRFAHATRADIEDREAEPSDEASRTRRPRPATILSSSQMTMRHSDGAAQAESATRVLVGRTVAAVERDLILHTLVHCGGNRTHAARVLDISIRSLRNKLSEYLAAGIAVAEPGGTRSAA